MATILVVDDNEQNLYMLQILFESNGYQVAQASHGGQALEAAIQVRPDLVISDILMPVMDGFALCRHWKANSDLKNIPFVFYTATYTNERDEQFAKSLGADSFLVKPLEPEVLLQVVAELVSTPVVKKGPEIEGSESAFLKQYNEALFHKLEKKVAELEETNAQLQRDMAMRKALENQLLQSQKMELMGQLASGIVHDFNNVLTSIGGMTSMLVLEKDRPQAVADRAAKIQEALQLGAALSRQVLTFARKQEFSLAPVDVNELIQASVPLICAALSSSIELELSAALGLPQVLADATQLKQVILNLVANARDAITPPGKVRIDTSLLVLDEEFVRQSEGKPGHYVRVRFQDTGAGMSSEVLGRIFEPFYTTKAAGQGTGLGLSMVYGIVRQHGGFLQVSSVVGRGSCFEVYLPVPGEK